MNAWLVGSTEPIQFYSCFISYSHTHKSRVEVNHRQSHSFERKQTAMSGR